ncbi:hypothetical protein L2E82_47314 [Cichorium intybus]|uniref:Uncharacterized protein n=1 Tax=Cichorium intybus TaxID=13427 RepID=A0ACB8YVF7_CICIN|nr:hypothetical protein L2E82_47314 [Cichorium intybus]
MVSTIPSTKEVSETSCSQACVDKVNKFREQNNILVREVFDLKNKIYNLKKGWKPLKEKLEAQTKDVKRIKEEYSEKSCHYRFAKEKIVDLTAELDALKAKFNDADFTFKKLDVSSAVVESMIEQQFKWKTKQGEGLGYSSVPPPFNDNYTPILETKEIEKSVLSYQPVASASVQTDQSATT